MYPEKVKVVYTPRQVGLDARATCLLSTIPFPLNLAHAGSGKYDTAPLGIFMRIDGIACDDNDTPS